MNVVLVRLEHKKPYHDAAKKRLTHGKTYRYTYPADGHAVKLVNEVGKKAMKRIRKGRKGEERGGRVSKK